MSVPLDRLYHYLDDCVNHDLLIYGWTLHGSRKLEDFGLLFDSMTPEDWISLRSKSTEQQFSLAIARSDHAVMICHDQEPLDFDRYSFMDFQSIIRHRHQKDQEILPINNIDRESVVDYCAKLGWRGLATPTNYYDSTLLLHSELHSSHVNNFEQQGYVPVYYWSHGMIAHDWFRYADHDPILKFNPNQITHDFLVYNRAWSGTREYRLCFAEQIVKNGLSQHCKMTFNSWDNMQYGQHQFVNSAFQISNFELEKFFPKNNHNSNASADYCNTDYASSSIEVVLETLFDDTRWHLTEKTLRPIACGRPFMLVATAGSLQYLRHYGFKTFSGLLDESYDTIQDPRQRLQAVITEMSRVANLPQQEKIQLFVKLNQIAEHNKHHFFNGFFDRVKQEYISNIDHAITTMNQHKTGKHDRNIRALMQ
jgi:hypothetical protein